MAIRAYSIGRSAHNDIVVNDASVSGRHAELVQAADGRLYLSDCQSTNGSFVDNNGQWQPLVQSFIEPQQTLRLGNITITAQQLLQQLNGSGPKRHPGTGEVYS
ncbi:MULTISPECIES: FHA domain-containing protein [Corallincola]|uniref:FHA domain-containing protein n=3 Tax=Corallincola TaxID=1775176 RepID=A0A368NJZ3_9GAMM|nr:MULTISPECIES: FHA domain-containing protein [Corallincola]RCU50927.1 FHA domain-containing protein [Corallincola holothuriorum]TAA45885.1 FHA domain-containing protein [Corallincola spongiicola]TCI03986.1 FHA domain-containing protein [Corallincola luteus]